MRRLIAYYGGLLKSGRAWLGAAGGVFLFGLLSGFALALQDPGQAGVLLEQAMRALRGTIGPISGGTLLGVWAVFLNNVRAMTIAMLAGVVLGLVPALVLLANGTLLGALVGLAWGGSTRLSLGLLPLALLPHGVVELPTLVLAGAWGLKLGLAWLAPQAGGRRLRVLLRTLVEAASVYLLAVVLLFIAATIEMLLTYALLRSVTGAAP